MSRPRLTIKTFTFGRRSLDGKTACASPKFCPALKSTACALSSAAISAMTSVHVPLRRIMVGLAHPLLAIASKPAPGKSRSSATAGCAEAQASQTPDGRGRQNLLGIGPSFLGYLEAVPRAGPTGDGRPLASSWFSPVLELPIEGEKTGR